MALHRYSRVDGLEGSVTVDVRAAYPPLGIKRTTVNVEGTGTLEVSDWDKLVSEVNTLLGRDAGSGQAAGGS